MALTEFGRRVKTRLIELDKKQIWLVEEVGKRTGLYVDQSYICKILRGELRTPKIIQAIRDILELDEEAENASA